MSVSHINHRKEDILNVQGMANQSPYQDMFGEKRRGRYQRDYSFVTLVITSVALIPTTYS